MYVKEVAIAGIVILEGIALVQGIDGAFLLPIVCIISGIAGYVIGDAKLGKGGERLQNGNN